MKNFLLLAVLALMPGLVHAQGALQEQETPTFESEGFNPIPFNVACATASWTVVVASDTISRSTFFENIPENSSNTICLLPFTGGVTPTVAISSQCISVTKGVHLPMAAAITDYTHAGWACASSSGTVTEQISGYRTRDSGDYGDISNPALQNR